MFAGEPAFVCERLLLLKCAHKTTVMRLEQTVKLANEPRLCRLNVPCLQISGPE
jgi:hypothetical protein